MLVFGVSLVASIFLFLFSFTQVDLSLTISQASVIQYIQKGFQYIGFYERPLAAAWFLGLLVVWYALYAWVLVLSWCGRLTLKHFWQSVAGMVLVLVCSYPAFSYDIFNYMFTAKTVLLYHKNPYMVTPIQFAGVEPWLSFMRWTHTPSAYTPLWILLSLPAYLIGFGYFLTTLWAMKLIAVISYILVIFFIGKILAKKDPQFAVLGMAIVAFNPLVVMESLVSGHNDIVMMAFAMASIYALVQGKKLKAWILMSLATAMKLMTIMTLPVVLMGYRPVWLVVAMSIGLLAVVSQREILPWYFVWIVPFVALVPRNRGLLILTAAVSLGLLLRYVPYFYFGHWDDPVPTIKMWVTLIPIGVAAVTLGVMKALKR
jgi:Gpi18-like mannosyltransferase